MRGSPRPVGWLALALSFALVAAACSGGDDPDGEGGGGAARTVTSDDGLVTIEIPAGVDADVGVTTLTPEELPQELQAFDLRGAVHDLQPDGATFDQPVTVTRTIDPEAIGADPAEAVPVVALLTKRGDEWDYLADQSIRVEDGMILVSGTTDHFSPLVATTSSAEVVTSEHLEKLPVARDYQSFLRLMPGVTEGAFEGGSLEGDGPLTFGQPQGGSMRLTYELRCDDVGSGGYTLGANIGGIEVPVLGEELGLTSTLSTMYLMSGPIMCEEAPEISWEEFERILAWMGAPPAIITDIAGDVYEDETGDLDAAFSDLKFKRQGFTDLTLSVAFRWEPTRESLDALADRPLGETVDGIEVLGQGPDFRPQDGPILGACGRTAEAVPWSPGPGLGTIEFGASLQVPGEPGHDASGQSGWPMFDGANRIAGARVTSEGAGLFNDVYDPATQWFIGFDDQIRVIVTDAQDGSATTYCGFLRMQDIAPLNAFDKGKVMVGTFKNQINFANGTGSSDFIEPREYRVSVGFRF